MDFESPDVMKEFPGLYASELNKMSNNDTDYSDEPDKLGKKDNVAGKRKDKKDKKDKERGYAALEGESSAEENCEVRSPSKSKKTKSFKFPSKSKEKREKSREKDKEVIEKKKEKEKKSEKKVEKDKVKSEKKEKKLKHEESCDIAEGLPIFGVSLKLAIERSRCHDGYNLPLPYRNCIDYLEAQGLHFEGIYKVSSPKSKVIAIKKMYNHREHVDLSQYDVPTVTGLLKLFLRELPEPIFTNELLIRFEEAGAILNVAMREKHLKILISNLPHPNKLMIKWIVVHLYNVTLNEKYNKMNVQSISMVLSSTLQTSQRLLTALLCHCPALFPGFQLKPYIPPLTSSAQLPDDPDNLEKELLKQESLLNQIHTEMNSGYILKQREEMLWEVQRIITQVKRKLKIAYKKEQTTEDAGTDLSQPTSSQVPEEISQENQEVEQEEEEDKEAEEEEINVVPTEENNCPVTLTTGSTSDILVTDNSVSNASSVNSTDKSCKDLEMAEVDAIKMDATDFSCPENMLLLLQSKNTYLTELKDNLYKQIEEGKNDITDLKLKLQEQEQLNVVPIYNDSNTASLTEIMDLLHKENQILQIKKINLVRQIMEQQESCIQLKAKLQVLDNV